MLNITISAGKLGTSPVRYRLRQTVMNSTPNSRKRVRSITASPVANNQISTPIRMKLSRPTKLLNNPKPSFCRKTAEKARIAKPFSRCDRFARPRRTMFTSAISDPFEHHAQLCLGRDQQGNRRAAKPQKRYEATPDCPRERCSGKHPTWVTGHDSAQAK